MTDSAKSGIGTAVLLTALSTFIYSICAGFRDNYGIMLPYLVQWSGISYATISFIIALGQLLFGVMQPVFGFLALRRSPRFALVTGALMMLAGLLLLPLSRNTPLMTLSLGILLPSGTAGASFGIIMSCIGPRLQPTHRHISSGFIASGIGLGICLLSPIIQAVITSRGLAGAIFFLMIPVSLLIPAALWITRGARLQETKKEADDITISSMLRDAVRNPEYRRAAAGFFTCGFHMAMIQTHLFSQLTSFGVPERAAAYALSVYGLGSATGAITSGWAITRFPMLNVLSVLYSSRVLWVILLLLPLPAPLLFMDIFLLGLTGVATVAPTSALVQKNFGPLRMATLFGFAYLLHQIGAFTSASTGGLCKALTGSYAGIWYIDIAFCLMAGLWCALKPKQAQGK